MPDAILKQVFVNMPRLLFKLNHLSGNIRWPYELTTLVSNRISGFLIGFAVNISRGIIEFLSAHWYTKSWVSIFSTDNPDFSVHYRGCSAIQ